MKKYLYSILIALIFLPIISCSNDEKEEADNLKLVSEKIIGNWNATHYWRTGDGWRGLGSESESDTKYFFNLKSNSTYETNYSLPESGSYKIKDAYSLNGKLYATIIFDNDEENYNFIEFNNDFSSLEISLFLKLTRK